MAPTLGRDQEERVAPLPVDELVAPGARSITRAITVHAQIDDVWPWLIQIGQDRAGFYSYTILENLVGAGMYNASYVHPEWQQRQPGDSVWLASKARWRERVGTHLFDAIHFPMEQKMMRGRRDRVEAETS